LLPERHVLPLGARTGRHDGLEFTNRLFEKTAVVVAAGNAYGQYGEGYIRISLTVPDNRLAEAMLRIEKEFG